MEEILDFSYIQFFYFEIFFVITLTKLFTVFLAFKEVLINYNTHDANKDSRNADKAYEEKQSHVFRSVAKYITNEQCGKSGEEYYEVIHVFSVSCCSELHTL